MLNRSHISPMARSSRMDLRPNSPSHQKGAAVRPQLGPDAYCVCPSRSTAKAAPLDVGDASTWTAIDADSKILNSYCVGDRTSETAIVLMDDLASRLSNRVQLTTDGHKAYLEAIEGAFGGDIDYAQITASAAT